MYLGRPTFSLRRLSAPRSLGPRDGVATKAIPGVNVPLGAVLGGAGEEQEVTPGTSDLQVSDRQALTPIATLFQDPDGAAVIGHDGGLRRCSPASAIAQRVTALTAAVA